MKSPLLRQRKFYWTLILKNKTAKVTHQLLQFLYIENYKKLP